LFFQGKLSSLLYVFEISITGMSPLIAAAERTRAEVVEYLVTRSEVSNLERIEALELLGASYANDKDNYCLELAYQYLHRTMKMR
jgi:Fem-1 family protein b